MEKQVQLLVRLPQSLHTELKVRAAFRNISMAKYIERIFIERIDKEKREEVK